MDRILLALVVVGLVCIQAESKVLYTLVMARHGAVYPPNDLYDGNQTKQFRGLLTPIGLRQHYNLGSYLHQDYIVDAQLTTPTFNPNHVEFYATSKQRTQNSALAFIYGLYPLGQGWTISNQVPSDKLQPPYTPLFPQHLSHHSEEEAFALNKGFQPLPVRPADDLLDNCPDYDRLMALKKASLSETIAAFQAQRRSLISRMSIVFKITQVEVNLQTMSDLYDTVYADLNLGRAMPSEFSQKDAFDLKYMYEFYNTLLFSGNFARVLATPTLRMIRARLQGVVNKASLKLSYVFGHHSNILPLINTLNLTSTGCLTQKYKGQTVTSLNCVEPPRYAANLIVEAHQDESLQFFVKVKYNGVYVNLCEREETQCPEAQFVARLQYSQANFEEECNVISPAASIVQQ